MEGNRRQQAEGSVSAATPPHAASPGPWEWLLGEHMAAVGAQSRRSRHSLSAAPTVHMAGAGCGHGVPRGDANRPARP